MNRVALALCALLVSACELSIGSSSIDAGQWDAGGLLCDENPCLNEGTCSLTAEGFQCTCRPGYEGVTCELDVNDCDPNPCKNDGLCADAVASYTCACAPGFEGVDCSTNIDECADEPCENGGTCTDKVNGYQCDCSAGYSGSRCEVNVDDCSPLPCENNGECVDEVNGFTCNCLPGSTGPTCSNQVESCSDGICQNGGTCENAQDGYTCTCTPGYNGVNCEADIDDCAALPCQNGANCVDALNGYACECVDGYEGVNCENMVDPCNPNPCQNNGACTIAGDDFYVCSCEGGYNGTNCEHNIDNCSTNPCANGGTCSDLVDDFSCTCPTGFTGPTCNNEPPTCPMPNPCNHGECKDGVNGYTCDCNPGYIGAACDVNVDDCQPNPCQNGGTCADGEHDYSCTCDVGYEGPDCQANIDDCASTPCKHGGTCSDRVNGFDCECVAGYSGDTCEANIDECTPNPCLNNGTCTDLINDYTCQCPPGYQGDRCETDHCSLIGVCGNGICDGQGGCTCDTGWTGTTCGEDVDECATGTPCLHGGACADTDGSFSCTCTTEYGGQTCADCADGYQDNDDDTVCCRDGHQGANCNQCENGYENVNGLCQLTCVSTGKDCGDHGTCADNNGEPACVCATGWFGEWCDSLMGTCSAQSCGTHGACNETSVNTYKCTCDVGYSGRNCEIVDECALAVANGETPCLNGGTCVDGNNAYTCTCSPGWLGAACGEPDNCYLREQQIGHDACNDHGACVDGNGTFTCTCDPGWLMADCSEQDNCVGNGCLNGGICVNGTATYTCDCTGLDFEGNRCQTPIDDCAPNPCLHDGVCSNVGADYECNCARTGYGGATCQTDSDECADTPAICQTGTCANVAAGGGYTCQCPDGTLDVDGDGTNCSPVASLAAGGLNTCAITTAGSLHCWGDNAQGQLGVGTLANPQSTEIRTPRRVGNGVGWTKVSLGQSHACGLRNGHLFCWGNNTSRQVGLTTSSAVSSPVEPRSDLTWTDVSSGSTHTCGLAGTALYCWGNSADAQAGTPVSGTVIDSPKQIAGTWSAVSAGGSHTCAINSASELRCWGLNSSGQTTGSQPTALPGGNAGPWRSVKAGPTHTCAVAGSQTYCWGAGTEGALGNGAYTSSSSPVLVTGSSTLTSLETGQDYSCGIENQGDAAVAFQIYCWGSNADSLLLTADVRVNTAQLVTTGTSPVWTAYAVGSHHMCGVDGGFVKCWGSNSSGAVGNAAPSATLVTAATRVTNAALPHSSVSYCSPNPCRNGGVCTSLASDYSCDCSTTGFGGKNCTLESDECATAGICGEGTCQDLLEESGYSCKCPDGLIDVDSTGTTCARVATIAAGVNHTCVLTETARTLHCWGSNRYGQFGLGNVGSTPYYPFENSQTYRTPLRLRTITGVTGEVSGWTHLAVGEGHTCATLPNGPSTEALYCWGDNSLGQVGDGIVTQTPPLPAAATSATVAPLYYAEPHVLDASRRWISLATSYATTCGIDSTNTLFCWGFSKYGQAGNGSSTPAPIMYSQAVAIPAPNSETWVSVAPGNAHTCATTAANNVYCWGRRNVGQAGVGSTGTDLQTPTIVNRATPQGFTSIYTDTTHSCALLGSSAFCWGQNSSGGVGTGVLTPTSVTSPTAVTGSHSFSGLTLGSNFACGLEAVPSTTPQAYNAWCWGNSNKGILLNDAPGVTPPTPNPTPTPTLMNTSRQWELLDLGATHICGVDHADGKLYCWGDNGIENSTGQGKVGSVPASQTGNVGLVGAVRAATVKHTTP